MKRCWLLVAALSGCAAPSPYVWDRAGATQADFDVDAGQCEAQALAGAGPPMIGLQANLAQIAQRDRIFDACMRGKGWALRLR